MSYQDNDMTVYLTKILQDMEKDKWITLSKDIIPFVVAVRILEGMVKVPYIYFVRWMKEFLP